MAGVRMVRGRGVAVTFEAGVAEAVGVRVASRRVAGAGVGGAGVGAPHPTSQTLARYAIASGIVCGHTPERLSPDTRVRNLMLLAVIRRPIPNWRNMAQGMDDQTSSFP